MGRSVAVLLMSTACAVAHAQGVLRLPSGCVVAPGNVPAPGSPGYRIVRERDSAELVWVPAGGFRSGGTFGAYVEIRFMGERKVDGFWLDRLEVTNRQYAVFCTATGHALPSLWRDGQPPADRDRHPVAGISRADALAYCLWAGGRLPTETEWEYAARGPDAKRYPWGDEFAPREAVWCGSRPETLTRATGSAPGGASWCGALDLAGNVYEWVWGFFHGYEGGGGLEAEEGRAFQILRGGSYYSMAECLRGSYRHKVRPGTVRADFGFRVAMDVPERARHVLREEQSAAASARKPGRSVQALTMRKRRTPAGARATEWPLPRRDLQVSGNSPARGRMTGPPHLKWELTSGMTRRGKLPENWSLFVDVDGDGGNELLWLPGGRLTCVRQDGVTWWTSDAGKVDWVADVDGDGQVEILCAGKVVSGLDGRVLWTPPKLKGGMGEYYVGKFIPDLPGLQIAGASEGPDQSNWAHVITFEDGIANGRLRWEHLMHPPSLAHVRGTVGKLDGRWVVMCTPQGRVVVRDIATGEEVFRTEFKSGRELIRNYGQHHITDLDGDGENEVLLLNDFVPQIIALAPRNEPSPIMWQNWIGWPAGMTNYYLQVAAGSLTRTTPTAPLEVLVSVHNLEMPGWALYAYDAVTGRINWRQPALYVCAVLDLDADGAMELVTERNVNPLKPWGAPADFPGVEIGRVVGQEDQRRYERLWTRTGARLERNTCRPRTLAKGGHALDEYTPFLADVDGDGGNELLVSVVDDPADLTAASVIAVGWQGGKLVEKAIWSVTGNKGLRTIAFGDWRPEPGPELVLGDESGQVQVLSPGGDTLHLLQASAAEQPAPVGDIAIADLGGDGDNELLGTIQDGTIAAFELPPGANGRLVELWRFRGRPSHSIYGGVRSIDTDGDGTREVLVETGRVGAPGRLTLLNHDGSMRWSAAIPGTRYSDSVRPTKTPAFGEFSGDGILDVAISRPLRRDYTGGGGDVLALDGRTGGLLWAADTGVYYGNVLNICRAATVWDCNRDGIDDIMGIVADEAYTMDGRDGTMLQLPADLTYKFNEAGEKCNWSAWGGLLIADHDLDGQPDTVVCTGNIGTQGAWDLQTRRCLWTNDPGKGYWGDLPAMGDVDGDGRAEILLADSKYQFLVRDVRTGAVEWDAKEAGAPNVAPMGVSADIDGDGRIEFIHAWGGWLWAMGCDASGTPGVEWKVWTNLQAPPISQPLIADVDNDGEPEILVTNKVYGTP